MFSYLTRIFIFKSLPTFLSILYSLISRDKTFFWPASYCHFFYYFLEMLVLIFFSSFCPWGESKLNDYNKVLVCGLWANCTHFAKRSYEIFLRMNSVLCAGLKIATHLILCLSLDARSPQPACAMNGDFTAHIIDWNGSKWWPAREKVERVGTKVGTCTLPSLQSAGQSPVRCHTLCSFIKLMTGVIINYIRTCNSMYIQHSV